MDLVGIDINCSVSKSVREQLGHQQAEADRIMNGVIKY